MPKYDIILYKIFIYLHLSQKKKSKAQIRQGKVIIEAVKRKIGGAVCGRQGFPQAETLGADRDY